MSDFLRRKKEEVNPPLLPPRGEIQEEGRRKKEEGRVKVLAAKNSKDFNSSFLSLGLKALTTNLKYCSLLRELRPKCDRHLRQCEPKK